LHPQRLNGEEEQQGKKAEREKWMVTKPSKHLTESTQELILAA